jgi:hypothetical protein
MHKKTRNLFSAKTAQKGLWVSDFALFLCANCDRFFIFQLNFFEKAREGWLFPPENAILFCRMIVLSCAAYAGFMMISEG